MQEFAAARAELDRTRGVTGVVVREVGGATLFSQRPDEVFPAASVIKIPLVMALYAEAADGRLSLEERMPVGAIVGGTGILGDLRDVREVSLRDLAMLAIALSDNTATNRLIDRLGVARVDERMAEWGCVRTKLARGMFDWDAQRRGLENVAAPSEMAALLERLVCGELVDRATSDAVVAVLERCQDDAMLRRYLAKGGRVANKTGTLAATRNDAAILFGPSRTIVVAAFMREVADPLAAVHILGLIGRGAARAAGLEVPPLPFDATAVLSLGLVCAAAFTGITVQANALERAKGVLSDEIAAEEARNAQLEASIAQKKTTDYLIQKAQDYDFVKQGEGLIAVERSAPSANVPRVDGGQASRVARWIKLFFGTRYRVRMRIAGWSSGSSSGS